MNIKGIVRKTREFFSAIIFLSSFLPFFRLYSTFLKNSRTLSSHRLAVGYHTGPERITKVVMTHEATNIFITGNAVICIAVGDCSFFIVDSHEAADILTRTAYVDIYYA